MAAAQPLPPPAAADPLTDEETALFCVGGHMSGLALNHQLIALGARSAPRPTVARYRLFALGSRAGLVAGGTGVIEGEIWALPTSAVGALLAQVPAPLGFGTVVLEDGPCLVSLAEAHATVGPDDISHPGGWRSYLRLKAEP